jgi:hypothetical protein
MKRSRSNDDEKEEQEPEDDREPIFDRIDELVAEIGVADVNVYTVNDRVLGLIEEWESSPRAAKEQAHMDTFMELIREANLNRTVFDAISHEDVSIKDHCFRSPQNVVLHDTEKRQTILGSVQGPWTLFYPCKQTGNPLDFRLGDTFVHERPVLYSSNKLFPSSGTVFITKESKEFLEDHCHDEKIFSFRRTIHTMPSVVNAEFVRGSPEYHGEYDTTSGWHCQEGVPPIIYDIQESPYNVLLGRVETLQDVVEETFPDRELVLYSLVYQLRDYSRENSAHELALLQSRGYSKEDISCMLPGVVTFQIRSGMNEFIVWYTRWMQKAKSLNVQHHMSLRRLHFENVVSNDVQEIVEFIIGVPTRIARACTMHPRVMGKITGLIYNHCKMVRFRGKYGLYNIARKMNKTRKLLGFLNANRENVEFEGEVGEQIANELLSMSVVLEVPDLAGYIADALSTDTLFIPSNFEITHYVMSLLDLPSCIKHLVCDEELFNMPIRLPSHGLESIRFGKYFNHPVDLPDGLQKVTFGRFFDQQVELPHGLQSVTFGDSFNQSVLLPESLQTLVFGSAFNKPIVLPPNLRSATFGSFNHPIDLPDSLQSVTFKDLDRPIVLPPGLQSVAFHRFNHPIELPEGLKSASFGWFEQHIELPDSLEHVQFGSSFDRPVTLPNGLLSAFFGSRFNRPITLPPNLKTVKFGNSFNTLINLPANISHVQFGSQFNRPITLPPSTETIIFGDRFNRPIDLPVGLSAVTFGYDFNQSIVLPQGIEHVVFGNDFNQPIELPPGLVSVTFGEEFEQPLENLPDTLKVLTIHGFYPYERSLALPEGCRKEVYY